LKNSVLQDFGLNLKLHLPLKKDQFGSGGIRYSVCNSIKSIHIYTHGCYLTCKRQFNFPFCICRHNPLTGKSPKTKVEPDRHSAVDNIQYKRYFYVCNWVTMFMLCIQRLISCLFAEGVNSSEYLCETLLTLGSYM